MLDGKYKFAESEKKWQDYWQEKNIYKFDKDSKEQIYSILSWP